ncbi:condensation domain-containing protein, partial [Streptomyces sp. NPDC048208]|uniref:condensation domain-containing protein n=1 Tax=Streptomyces sp. NPDC048208 TaxID=3365515 RepID=UPI00371D342E
TTETEKVLAGLFADILNLDHVGIDDSFFTLGGDSILSIQLVSRARTAGFHIAARDVFEHKTVAALARAARHQPATEEHTPDIATGEVPLTPIIHWLRERGGPTDAFHQAMFLQVPADLGLNHLTTAVQRILDHHDALRLRLTTQPHWTLDVLPAGQINAADHITRVDITDLPAHESLTTFTHHAEQARNRLNPANATLVQIIWFDAGPHTPGRLLIMIHHLAVDGVSWRILTPDLAAAWNQAAHGHTPTLQPATTSFRTWAHHLHRQALTPQREQELELWTNILNAPDQSLSDLPLDPARDVTATAGTLTTTLPAHYTEPLLTTLPDAYHGKVTDILLTALALAVCDWRRHHHRTNPHVLVNLEGHGREDITPHTDLTRTIGWFTSLFPVHLDLDDIDLDDAISAGPSLTTAIKRVKEHLRTTPDNGIGYGLLRYLNPHTTTTLKNQEHQNRPHISFNYLGRFGTDTHHTHNWTPAPEGAAFSGSHPNHPLTHTLDINAATWQTPNGPQLTITCTWPQALLDHHTVQTITNTWTNILKTLTTQPHTGGLTPSDLTLLNLTQNDIDELELD